MKKTILALVTLASLMGMARVGLGQESATNTVIEARRVEYPEPEEGWLMFPQEFELSRAWGQARERGAIVTGYSVVDSEGMLRVFLMQSGPDAVDSFRLRLVVFSRDGARHPLQQVDAGGMKNSDTEVYHVTFKLDPKVLAADQIAHIAIERAKPTWGRKTDPK